MLYSKTVRSHYEESEELLSELRRRVPLKDRYQCCGVTGYPLIQGWRDRSSNFF